MGANNLTNKSLKDIVGQESQLVEEETLAEINHSNRIVHIRENCNIPKRYLTAELEPKTEQQRKLKEKFKEAFNGKNLEQMSDLLIFGNVGTGKTYLTIGLLNMYINRGLYCRYVTEYELLELYMRKEYTKFEAFKKVDFLVIDELGKIPLQDWQMIQLEELISYRHNEMKTTVYITNMSQKSFKEFVGDRVIDRLRENNVVTALMKGDSLRGNSLQRLPK